MASSNQNKTGYSRTYDTNTSDESESNESSTCVVNSRHKRSSLKHRCVNSKQPAAFYNDMKTMKSEELSPPEPTTTASATSKTSTLSEDSKVSTPSTPTNMTYKKSFQSFKPSTRRLEIEPNNSQLALSQGYFEVIKDDMADDKTHQRVVADCYENEMNEKKPPADPTESPLKVLYLNQQSPNKHGILKTYRGDDGSDHSKQQTSSACASATADFNAENVEPCCSSQNGTIQIGSQVNENLKLGNYNRHRFDSNTMEFYRVNTSN